MCIRDRFYIDFTPDIINCNDWQTALVPVYLNLYYRHLDKFNRIKTIFTIHNIAYQGKYCLLYTSLPARPPAIIPSRARALPVWVWVTAPWPLTPMSSPTACLLYTSSETARGFDG